MAPHPVAQQAHITVRKIVPAVFTLFAFFFLSERFNYLFENLTTEQWFYFLIFFVAGIVFIIEFFQARPNYSPSGSVGKFTMLLTLILAILSWSFVIAIYFFDYNPVNDTGDGNMIAQFTLILAIILYLAQAYTELFRGEKLHEALVNA